MRVVMYHGQVIDVPSIDGLKNIAKCYNPICKLLVQTRPGNAALAGRPKFYCNEKCRWKWKRKRNAERKRHVEH